MLDRRVLAIACSLHPARGGAGAGERAWGRGAAGAVGSPAIPEQLQRPIAPAQEGGPAAGLGYDLRQPHSKRRPPPGCSLALQQTVRAQLGRSGRRAQSRSSSALMQCQWRHPADPELSAAFPATRLSITNTRSCQGRGSRARPGEQRGSLPLVFPLPLPKQRVQHSCKSPCKHCQLLRGTDASCCRRRRRPLLPPPDPPLQEQRVGQQVRGHPV